MRFVAKKNLGESVRRARLIIQMISRSRQRTRIPSITAKTANEPVKTLWSIFPLFEATMPIPKAYMAMSTTMIKMRMTQNGTSTRLRKGEFPTGPCDIFAVVSQARRKMIKMGRMSIDQIWTVYSRTKAGLLSLIVVFLCLLSLSLTQCQEPGL